MDEIVDDDFEAKMKSVCFVKAEEEGSLQSEIMVSDEEEESSNLAPLPFTYKEG